MTEEYLPGSSFTPSHKETEAEEYQVPGSTMKIPRRTIYRDIQTGQTGIKGSFYGEHASNGVPSRYEFLEDYFERMAQERLATLGKAPHQDRQRKPHSPKP